MRYLRNTKDGFIYEWNAILAENSLCVEVSEQEAYPEKFIPEAQRGRKPRVSLETESLPEEPKKEFSPELAAEASIGLPQGGHPNLISSKKV